MSSFSSKRARTEEVSRLAFLPSSWWEYLDWVNEAHKMMNQVTGDRSNPGMGALLTFVERSITEYFG
jgi:hypothetical protein